MDVHGGSFLSIVLVIMRCCCTLAYLCGATKYYVVAVSISYVLSFGKSVAISFRCSYEFL